MDDLDVLLKYEENTLTGFQMKKSSMHRPNPPTDRPVFWIRFIGSLFFFGFILGLIAIQFVDMLGIVPCIGLWATLSVGVSLYVATVGYDALRDILTLFMP